MNNFKASFLTLLCFLIWAVQAQDSSIKGSLKDIHGNPIGFVDVILVQLPDSSQTASVLSNELGIYEFSNIAPGQYLLVAHMADLNETLSKHIEIGSQSAAYEHHMVMEISQTEVEEVVMTSQRAVVRQDADKMIVSVEASLASSGLTGADVLRRVPGISVDRDGKVSLKGRAGVQVMLDDKPLYMSESQLGDLLKSIPSDLIKEIEVITSPSAKYDAVGNAGIVNIRLKEGAYEGLNGNANASLGTGVYHKGNIGASISYKKKKHALDAGYQYNNARDLDVAGAFRKSLDPSIMNHQISSDATFKNKRQSHSLFLKGQYQLYKSGSIGYNGNLMFRNVDWGGNMLTLRQNGEGLITERYDMKDGGLDKGSNINLGMDFTHQFDTLGTKLSSEVSYNKGDRYGERSLFSLYQDSSMNTPTASQLSSSTSDHGQQWSAKVDFAKTLAKRVKMETGLKVNEYSKWEPQAFQIEEQGTMRDTVSNFRFRERVSAAYLMASGKVNKWKLQAGLRVENTQSVGEVTAYDTTFRRNYTNLFPSMSASYQSSEKTSYTLMYSKRIQRPNVDQLSPALSMFDKYTRWGGSPYLLPEYAHNVELAYSKFGGYLITTLNYSHTDNLINWVVEADPRTLVTIMGDRNLKYMRNFGVSVAVNMPLTSWWQTSNYIYLYHNEFVGDLGYGVITAKSNTWKANSTQTFKLPKGFSVELSGSYDAKGAYSIGTYRAFGQLNAAVQKTLFKNKASLKLAYSDLFWTHRYQNTATYNYVYSVGTYRWDNRVFMCTFTYKFGKRMER